MQRSLLNSLLFYFAVIVIIVISVYPFYYAVLTSFETGTALFTPNLLPEMLSLDNYNAVLTKRSFIQSVFNSVLGRFNHCIFCTFISRYGFICFITSQIQRTRIIVTYHSRGIYVSPNRCTFWTIRINQFSRHL